MTTLGTAIPNFMDRGIHAVLRTLVGSSIAHAVRGVSGFDYRGVAHGMMSAEQINTKLEGAIATQLNKADHVGKIRLAGVMASIDSCELPNRQRPHEL